MAISIIPVEGLPEVGTGDDVAALIVEAIGAGGDALGAGEDARGAEVNPRGAGEDARGAILPGDVVVIAHKIVSKAEGRVVAAANKGELVLSESARILRLSQSMTISETRHGFVCANAGVDASNVEGEQVVLLPLDPDLSARRIHKRLALLTGSEAAVVITDTFGRAWRLGQTNVAIGVAGIDPFIDYRGTTDSQGREMQATRICVADELAGAAELVMGKARGVPAAIVRGASVVAGRGSAAQIVRPPEEDLFR